jgi:hypothetical protein
MESGMTHLLACGTPMLASGGEDLGMVFFAISGAVAIISIVANQWRRVRLGEYDAHLKRTMLERGMSGDEIERVLAAGKRGRKND